MGDFVKGNKYSNYSDDIKNGILLHRQIDTFTDNHLAHKSSRNRFREGFGLYSGIVVDIVYDYFLASQWEKFHSEPLEVYAQKVYRYIELNKSKLPIRLQQISPFLIENNWFLMYRSFDGIERVLSGMSKRTSLPQNVNFAMKILNSFNDELNNEFHQIIKDLLKMVEKSVFLPKFIEK